MKHFNFSMEDSDITNTEATPDTSKTIHEKEYVFYVRIANFKQLENATHAEKQEQWEVKIPRTDLNKSEGKLRVRKITSSTGEVKYELTLKNKTKEGDIETTLLATEELFTQVAFLAESGMRKDRYTFPIDGSDMKFEVDVYPDGKAGYYAWAKIDLEVKSALDKLPELPIEVEEVITPNDAITEEGKTKVEELYQMFFLIPNKYQTPEDISNNNSSTDISESDAEDTPEENQDTTDDTESSDSDDSNSDNEDTNTHDNQDSESNDNEENNESESEDKTEESDNEDGESDQAS